MTKKLTKKKEGKQIGYQQQKPKDNNYYDNKKQITPLWD